MQSFVVQHILTPLSLLSGSFLVITSAIIVISRRGCYYSNCIVIRIAQLTWGGQHQRIQYKQMTAYILLYADSVFRCVCMCVC